MLILLCLWEVSILDGHFNIYFWLIILMVVLYGLQLLGWVSKIKHEISQKWLWIFKSTLFTFNQSWIISQAILLCFNSNSASHDNWCTAILWNRTMTAQCEGMGEVGSARYEPALLPPCPSIRVLSYNNCQEIHSRQQTGLAVQVLTDAKFSLEAQIWLVNIKFQRDILKHYIIPGVLLRYKFNRWLCFFFFCCFLKTRSM